MIQRFIELSLLVIGLYAAITGRLPLAFGGNPAHVIEPRAARLIGILFISPFPILLCIGMSMGIAGVPIEKVVFIEPLTILLIIVIAIVIIQKSKKPVEAMDDLTKET